MVALCCGDLAGAVACVEGEADGFVDEFCGEEVAGGLVGDGGEFYTVDGDDVGAAGDDADDVEGLGPGESAWFGGAGGWDEGGVEAVEVDGEEDVASAYEFAEGCEVPTCVDIFGEEDVEALRVAADEGDFFAADRADAELYDGGAKIVDAAGDAGVAVAAAFVFVAQVAVGVDLDHDEVVVQGVDGAGDACGDGVFAAECDEEFAGVEQFGGAGFDGGDHGFWAADVGGERGEGVDAVGECGFVVEFAVVEFDLS